MGSSNNWMKTGSVVGETSATKKVILGFKPRSVQLENITGLVSAYKSDLMAGSSAVKRVTAGTMTFPANMITLEDDGFTIGNDSDLMVDAEVIHYTAWEGKNE